MFSVTDAKRLKDTGFAIQDATVNGYFTEDGIAINISSSKALNTIVGHELTHALEGSELYDALKDVVVEYAKTTGDYNSHIAALKQIYSGKKGYETDLDAKAERELVADLCGDYLFSDTDFISRLSVKNRNLFQKIYDEIKYLAKLATSGSKEARQLEKVKHLFEQVYRDTKNTAHPDGVKYDIVALDNGNVFVKASRNVITGKTKAEQRKNITDFFNNLLDGNNFLDIQTIEGDVLTITKAETANKARDDYKTVNGNAVKMTADEFAVKLRVESHIDEIAEISSKKNNSSDNKNHAFAKDGFTYRRAYFEDFDGQYYEITLSIGHNGSAATVYNVGKVKESVLPSAKIIAVVGSKALDKTLSTDSLSENDQNVNSKLSLSENSEGNVPAGDQTYGQDVEIDLYDAPEVEEAWDADTDGETDVQGIDAEIEQHLATSMETSRKMDAAAEAGDMEQYRTYKAMYNSLEERIRFLYQQKADANAVG